MPPRTYPEGVPSWVDVEIADVDAAQEFYGGLFGWTFEQASPPGLPFRYLIAKLGGQDVAGVGGPASGPPAWNTYIAVDDADAATARITAAGGAVVSPPEDAGEGGRSAICADPAGVRFRLWQARRRPGAQLANAHGAWNVSDLHAADPDAVVAFYTAVFGWEVSDLGFARMIRRPGYGDHLESTVDPRIRERQAGDVAPSGFEDAVAWLAPVRPEERPHWHVTFAVDDRDEVAAAAQRLGATVISTEDTEWTRAALLRDPQGAELTASQFTPPSG